MRCLARIGDREIAVEVARRGPGRYAVRVAGEERAVEARRDGASLSLGMDGRRLEAIVVREGDGNGAGRAYAVTVGGRLYPVTLLDPLRRCAAAAGVRRAGRADVRSIMPGRVAALLVQEGQEVRAGQGVVVVEAMKMENELPSPKDGRVTSLRVVQGQTVEAGTLLFTVE
jgi:biotin carboxyl carrier protein